ncbi:cobalamin biosynthesis protein [Actinoplanes derwentensis]|uniref:Cobalt-precorrin 5A hydrolase n=1 Tax=Actinoplanes derwentensis TaxID=113562 RepID=A0A1H1PZ60_9ACTN|nr:cobalamin biosynthesis protein [Actinoplanes derwentensis]GID82287.1 hypothetical protein Ade03nite_12110 [Actinoplanes derwentensis]SDS16406.1 cobalt-precorrin 5A hydrolase [Actinoplanes derwentensis]
MIVLGLGARSGADLAGPVRLALAAAGLLPDDVGVLATLDRRAAEDRVLALAREHDWRIAAFTAHELAACPVPNPGRAAAVAVGTPSVAEAAALLAAGPGAELIMPKRSRAGVTVALAVIQRPGFVQYIC